jgi:hypothetical protein
MHATGLDALTEVLSRALVAAAGDDMVIAAEALADAEQSACSPARQAAIALAALQERDS